MLIQNSLRLTRTAIAVRIPLHYMQFNYLQFLILVFREVACHPSQGQRRYDIHLLKQRYLAAKPIATIEQLKLIDLSR